MTIDEVINELEWMDAHEPEQKEAVSVAVKVLREYGSKTCNCECECEREPSES